MDINGLLRGLQTSREKRAYNPNELMLDNGRSYDASRLLPGQIGSLGEQQEDMRRSSENRRDWESGRVLRTNTNAVGISPNMRGYFGVLQAKENAAGAAGKKFDVDFAGQPGNPKNSGWGTWSYQADGGPSRNLMHDVRTQTDTAHPAFQALAGLRRLRR